MTDPRFEILAEPLTGREVYRARARGGTEVWVMPMPGFRRAYASLSARYGSRDDRLPGGERLPEGTAHFLEHRMFQGPEGDVFDLYAARGASANAYTTFDHTCYLFDCTTRFAENLGTLIGTLSAFHQDPPGIDRERGIIAQEIATYADDPGWRGYFQLLHGLYHAHPVRHDIAGTARTIARIDGALLERVHAAYYHPRNLILVAAGAVDPDLVLAAADEGLRGSGRGRRLRRPAAGEPAEVRRPRARLRLPIERASVYLGFKQPAPGRGIRRLRRQVAGTLALDLLCGDGGRVQRVLYDEGWIDESFHGSYEDDHDYAFASIAADVEDPNAFLRRLRGALDAACTSPLAMDELERARRRLLGRHLRRFNAPGMVADWLLEVALDGNPLAAGVAALRALTPRALERQLRNIHTAPQSVSIVAPLTR